MIRSISLAAAAVLLTTPAFADCIGFMVHDPYARASTAMSTSGAAFMVMHNHGESDCHVTGARSDAAQRTELHTHIMDDNGVMRMVHVEEGFVIPADGELVLQRGAEHVMFMGLNAPFEPGNVFNLTFELEGGEEYTVEVPVDLERMPMQGEGHGQGHGDGHNTGHGHNN